MGRFKREERVVRDEWGEAVSATVSETIRKEEGGESRCDWVRQTAQAGDPAYGKNTVHPPAQVKTFPDESPDARERRPQPNHRLARFALGFARRAWFAAFRIPVFGGITGLGIGIDGAATVRFGLMPTCPSC